MNAKTLEAVTKHGNALLAAFPNCTEKDPVALCKKLRRIETSVAKWTLQACNGPAVSQEKLDEECHWALVRVQSLMLGCHEKPDVRFIINRDPRGYALKLDSEWTAKYNHEQFMRNDARLMIHTDTGGYGILAPKLD